MKIYLINRISSGFINFIISTLSCFDKITIGRMKFIFYKRIFLASNLITIVPTVENIEASKGWNKTTLPTWDNVGAWRWLLCKWSSILAINGAAAVMKPNLIPLLTTLEKESSLITLPSVSSDKNDFGSTYAIRTMDLNILSKIGGAMANCPRCYFSQSNVE